MGLPNPTRWPALFCNRRIRRPVAASRGYARPSFALAIADDEQSNPTRQKKEKERTPRGKTAHRVTMIASDVPSFMPSSESQGYRLHKISRLLELAIDYSRAWFAFDIDATLVSPKHSESALTTSAGCDELKYLLFGQPAFFHFVPLTNRLKMYEHMCDLAQQQTLLDPDTLSVLNTLLKRGSKLFAITSRPSHSHKSTLAMLSALGISFEHTHPFPARFLSSFVACSMRRLRFCLVFAFCLPLFAVWTVSTLGPPVSAVSFFRVSVSLSWCCVWMMLNE